jgi:hypothetical protein
MTQLNLLVKDRDGIGQTREEVEKTGGEFLYLSPGLEWRPTEGWRAYALVQVPVYQRVNSLQTTSDCNVLVGIEYRVRFGMGQPSDSRAISNPSAHGTPASRPYSAAAPR